MVITKWCTAFGLALLVGVSGCADVLKFHDLELAQGNDASVDATAPGQGSGEASVDAALDRVGPKDGAGMGDADAACTLCGGQCVDVTSDQAHCGSCANGCLASQVCQAGQCACTGNETLCGTAAGQACLDLMTDMANCGACSHACMAGTVCQAGKCICPGAETPCGTDAGVAACTYLTSDHANCGSCGNVCAPGATCQGGACVCPTGQAMCGNAASPACADPMTDHANCGGCGTACGNGAACVSGKCVPCASMTSGKMCGTPLMCVDTSTDHGNCGGCGNPCLVTQVCQGGQCVCPAGEMLCGSGAAQACVTPSSDQNNCGKCGLPCTGGAVCQGGVCGCSVGFHNCSGTCVPDGSTSTSSCGKTCALCPAPASGQATCEGTPPVCGQSCPTTTPTLCGAGGSASCVNTLTDANHCGGCNTPCSTNNAVEKCTGSTCSVVACSAGFADCDHNPANGCETHTVSDPANCGACGAHCSMNGGTETCVSGVCSNPVCNTPLADCDHNPANGCEVDTSSDVNHCGGCGVKCPTGTNCSGGICSPCGVGTMLCGTACVTCPARPLNGTLTCSNGMCVGSCPNATLPNLCGTGSNAACVNTQTDQGNCGACGSPCTGTNKCDQTYSCQAGVCAGSNPVTCPPAGDGCHAPGTCNPATGVCSAQTQLSDGTACTGPNKCDSYACMGGACTGMSSVACTATDACHVPGACAPGTGVCSAQTQEPDGTSCMGSNKCDTYACAGGTCTGTPSVTCTASDGCHLAGVCNSSTGVCSNPPAAAGTPCNGSNACLMYACDGNGTCVGSHPGTCTAMDQCHVAGTCNSSTGTCSNPNAPNGTGCNDGNPCTQGDSCQNGTCAGTPVTCTASDGCHQAGSCNPSTGICSNPSAPNGTGCNDGNACTVMDTCQNGVCGGNAITCTSSDQCHVAGTCNSGTGMCSNPAISDGTGCTGTNLCEQSYTCQSGTCTGSNPVMCAAMDPCHGVGMCDPTTGLCSNPPLTGNSCTGSGNLCEQSYTCQSGTCTGSNPVTCAALDSCHGVGACDPSTGTCSNPTLPDGTACAGAAPGTTCLGGVCQCPSGTMLCTPMGGGSSTCADLTSDPNNCGMCNVVCGPPAGGGPPSCSGSACAM